MVSCYKINDIKVHKYVMPFIESNMYILVLGKEALVIDPHEDDDAVRLLNQHHVETITILLTHEHYDHIFGVNFFKEKWECTVYGSKKCGERVQNPKANLSAFFQTMFITKSELEQAEAAELFCDEYTCRVDIDFEKELDLKVGSLSVRMIETPGHSPGSICILVNQAFLFTGDSLVEGNAVITRLPGGSKKEYNRVTKPFLESLPDDMVLFPGHGKEGRKSCIHHMKGSLSL